MRLLIVWDEWLGWAIWPKYHGLFQFHVGGCFGWEACNLWSRAFADAMKAISDIITECIYTAISLQMHKMLWN